MLGAVECARRKPLSACRPVAGAREPQVASRGEAADRGITLLNPASRSKWLAQPNSTGFADAERVFVRRGP